MSGILDRLEVAFRLMSSTNWTINNQVKRIEEGKRGEGKWGREEKRRNSLVFLLTSTLDEDAVIVTASLPPS